MPIDGMSDRPALRFLDLDFSPLRFDEVVAEIGRRSRSPDFSYFVTPNVDHVVKLFPKLQDGGTAAFRNAYAAASLRLCDSRIIRTLAKLCGVSLPLITGSDLTAALFRHHFEPGCKVAIIGGRADMIARLNRVFPGPEYVQHVPPMKVLTNERGLEEAVLFLRQSRPHFTLFAIGAPQSEVLAHRCLVKGGVSGIGLCIGASIEFILGDQKRAPKWMQRSGLEWLYRLGSDPARLWRRYLIEGPRILWIVLQWRRNKQHSGI